MSDINELKPNEKLLDVKCPKCEHVGQFLSWQCINATEENGMKEKVRDQSAFLFTCPQCGAKINVEYPFLYHQVEDRLMLHYAITDENFKSVVKLLTAPEDDAQKKMVRQFTSNDYIIRIVRTKASLLEKIAIYENGFDDRYVEICKAILASGFVKQYPDKKLTGVFYAKTADEGNIVKAYVDGKVFGTTEFNLDLYKNIVNEYKSEIPPLRADRNLVVDQRWAVATIKKVKDKMVQAADK